MKHATTVTFRQSWAKNFLICPERGRLSAFDAAFQAADTSSDATTLGSAMHEYMEGRLHGMGHGQAYGHADAWLQEEIDLGTFEWVQIKTAKTLLGKLDLICQRMRGVADDIIMQLGYPLGSEIERKFDVPLAPDSSIRLSGMWDCRWPDHRLIKDWKTAAQLDRYQQWEIDRWYVQPTFYCVAAEMVDLVDEHGSEQAALEQLWDPARVWSTRFDFEVVDKGTNPNHAMFPTERNGSHAGWLLEQLESFVAVHDGMGTDGPWPKNDQHALCSSKWCPAWDTCKGKHL